MSEMTDIYIDREIEQMNAVSLDSNMTLIVVRASMLLQQELCTYMKYHSSYGTDCPTSKAKHLNQSIFTIYIEILQEFATGMIPLNHHEIHHKIHYEFTFIQGNNQCHRDRIIPSLKQIHTHIHTKEMTSVIVTGSYLL